MALPRTVYDDVGWRPATVKPTRHIRILSDLPVFPWVIEVRVPDASPRSSAEESRGGSRPRRVYDEGLHLEVEPEPLRASSEPPGPEYVTVLDVWAAIYDALQQPLRESEWINFLKLRTSNTDTVERRRAEIDKAVQDRQDVEAEDLEAAALDPFRPRRRRNRKHRSARSDGSDSGDKPLEVKRVDCLTGCTIMRGLSKDDEYAQSLLAPGSTFCDETWILQLRYPYRGE